MSDDKRPDTLDEDFEQMLAAALGTTPDDEAGRALAPDALPEDDTPSGFKSGYVAVVGQPNVGKSTLINQMMGEKIAIVSPKPQTTRLQQLGILNRPGAQVIFIDTPGIHQPVDELGEFMVEVARAALHDADLILFVVAANRPPNAGDRQIIAFLESMADKVILVMNKVDLAKDPARFAAIFETYETLLPDAERLTTTATDGYNVAELLDMILERLPAGPRYYPADQVSDMPLRSIAAETIREKVLLLTRQEVPHSIAVEVDEFKARNANLTYIHATVFCERDGQKGIIIGKGGEMLKRIAAAARTDIEMFLGTRVYLDVRVKVWANWRKDLAALQRFGYRL